MIVLAILAGYLAGSAPSANGLARIAGIDLRTAGTGNPGANNARQLGGYPLAVAILVVEAIKGMVTVLGGAALAGESGAVLAGLAAVSGNVYNPWYGFKGGKGVAITLGVLVALWPLAALPLLVVMVVVVLVTKSSGKAVLSGLAAAIPLAVVWVPLGWPTVWGASKTVWLVTIALGLSLILMQSHLADAFRPHGRPEPQGPASPARR